MNPSVGAESARSEAPPCIAPELSDSDRAQGVYDYSCYGLRIQSQLALPELPVLAAPLRQLFADGGDARLAPDVRVEFGSVAVPLRARAPGAAPDLNTPFLEVMPAGASSPGEAVFQLTGVGRFRVIGGNRVVIDADDAASESDLRVFLLGTVLGLLAHQRGWLPLHAAAIEVDGEIVALAGCSGAGKSTLAAALWRRGHRVWSDDVTMIRPSQSSAAASPTASGVQSHPQVLPGVPRLRLWRDTFQAFDWRSEGLERCRGRLEKFSRPIIADGGDGISPFSSSPLAAVIHLQASAPQGQTGGGLLPGPAFERLRGHAAVYAFSEQLYKRRARLALCGEGPTAMVVTAAAARIPAHLRLFRPLRFDALDATVDAILETLRMIRPSRREAAPSQSAGASR